MTSELAVVMAVVALVWRQAALVLVEACLACTSSQLLLSCTCLPQSWTRGHAYLLFESSCSTSVVVGEATIL